MVRVPAWTSRAALPLESLAWVRAVLVRHVIWMPDMERVAITLTMPHPHPYMHVCDFLLTFSVRMNHVCSNARAHVACVQLGAA